MPLFVTRLIPNLRSSEARRDLADAYEMHRTLMRGFPDLRRTPNQPTGVLWRVDLLAADQSPMVLVQSTLRPAWAALPDNWLCPAERLPSGIGLPEDIKHWDPKFAVGKRLRFRLRANPTKRLRRQSKDHTGKPIAPAWVGKRVEIREPDQQIAWLHSRTIQPGSSPPQFWLGFRLVEVRPQPPREHPVFAVAERQTGKILSIKRKDGVKQSITHAAVVFEGLLEITEPGLIRQTLAAGIGPGKAFGFGLLSLAPA